MILDIFDAAEDVLAQEALNKQLRDKRLLALLKVRAISLLLCAVISVLTFVIVCVNLVAEHSVSAALPSFMSGSIMLLFANSIYYNTDNEIRLLKIVGALQEAQRTKDNTASS